MRGFLGVLAAMLSFSAGATLNVGDAAPDFSAQASIGGTEYTYKLSAALKTGPVVLYFYPAAFTTGCTIEAHNFAEAVDKYKVFGATVIGVSADNMETLHKFSTSECRGKFPVASDANQSIMKSYDAVLLSRTAYASRTSYVIAPNGKIIYAYSAMSPDKHVENTLAAVRDWAAAKK